MSQPLVPNLNTRNCPSCYSFVQIHTHGAHTRVCPGVQAREQPFPGWQFPALGNGWRQQPAPAPQTAYRITWDNDLQIVLTVIPGTYGQPVFTLLPDWIPAHSMSVPGTDPQNFSVIVVTVQGAADTSPGAVTVTRSGTPPATVDAAIRIPMML